MASTNPLHIDLFAAAHNASPLRINLSNDFFEALEQNEIIGGNMDVTVIVAQTAGDFFRVSYKLKGEVRVACDRCLDDLDLEIDTSDNITVYYGDASLQIEEELRYYAYEGDSYTFPVVCHGDYQYHNILRTEMGNVLINFEKCVRDYPVRDLYLFLRKLLEKNNWSQALGNLLLESYNKERNLTDRDYRQLYYRLAYPEKFWKIVNFYYNTGKAWIPGRNMEKIEKLFAQEREKQLFLENIFRK